MFCFLGVLLWNLGLFGQGWSGNRPNWNWFDPNRYFDLIRLEPIGFEITRFDLIRFNPITSHPIIWYFPITSDAIQSVSIQKILSQNRYSFWAKKTNISFCLPTNCESAGCHIIIKTFETIFIANGSIDCVTTERNSCLKCGCYHLFNNNSCFVVIN